MTDQRCDGPTGDPIGECRLDGVRVVFGGTAALDGVDLVIAAGTTVGLVGPSGAGKTTLLRLLAGTMQPSSGSVGVGGVDPASVRDRRVRAGLVGLLPQAVDLVPSLSVKRNVEAGLLGRWGAWRSLAALVLPTESPAARAAVARVGLEDRFADRVDRLSGGEQQRVALARVLVQDPVVVLADEPVSSLDPARADDLLALLVGLARERGRTLVTSLHTPGLALGHLDRVVGLRAGHVIIDLPAADVTPADLDRIYRLEVA